MRTSLFAASTLFLLAATMRGETQSRFSTKVEAVRLDVLVTANGQPVRGLRPADFDVRDNGVPQQVDLVAFEQIPLKVVLALDMSGSVTGERLEHLRGAGRALLSGLKTEDQAALLTFSHVVVPASGLTRDLAQLRAALDGAELSGQTSLVDGTYAGLTIAESDAGRSLLVVFSDGVDTLSWLSPPLVLETARRSETVVYSVTVETGQAPEFLRDLSELTGGKLFEIRSTADLGDTFVKLLEEFRHRYLVSYTPRGVAKDGWHRLDVGVKGRKATVKTRHGYLAS